MKYSRMKIYGKSMTSMEKRDLKIIKGASMRAGATTVTISVRCMLLIRSILSPPAPVLGFEPKTLWPVPPSCVSRLEVHFLIQVEKKSWFCCLIYIFHIYITLINFLIYSELELKR